MVAVLLGVLPIAATAVVANRAAGAPAQNSVARADAERAVKERIRIHPGCPRAHFAYAQLLSKERRNDEARRELREAERLQPGLSFAPAASVDDLARKLGMSKEIPPSGPQQSHF